LLLPRAAAAIHGHRSVAGDEEDDGERLASRSDDFFDLMMAQMKAFASQA